MCGCVGVWDVSSLAAVHLHAYGREGGSENTVVIENKIMDDSGGRRVAANAGHSQGRAPVLQRPKRAPPGHTFVSRLTTDMPACPSARKMVSSFSKQRAPSLLDDWAGLLLLLLLLDSASCEETNVGQGRGFH